MKKIKSSFNKYSSNNLMVFAFLLIVILFAYQTLFNSYFESDEWFYFTYYFPLTKEPHGWLIALLATFTQSGYISGGQHVVPIASLIYYMNTKLFGLNFVPYAFMSLFVHSINSYLVFLVVKLFLKKRSPVEKYVCAYISALFFALSPIPMHAFTGFAAFYGQNVLSTTFLLLCIFLYELWIIKGEKKYIFFTVITLFLALLTQESTFFLFFVLPVMTFFKKKRKFYRFLSLLWISCLFFYILVRFLIPNMHYILERIERIFIPNLQVTSHSSLAQGLSIYPNLPAELFLRSITFPLKMLGSIFIPTEINISVLKMIAPIISPYPPGGDSSVQAAFINYSGQSIIIYAIALIIIISCAITITRLVKKKNYEEATTIIVSLSIILFGALPLVAIIFSFPLWGYAVYFDSRYYYTPHIGAAILFPILILNLSNFIAKHKHKKKSVMVASFFFILYALCNIPTFVSSLKTNTQNYSQDRRMVVKQFTENLPKLQSKTVFYIETDGKSPFESLPFFTSVPQALTVAYYGRNSLPNSFFNKPLFSGNPQGYQYEKGRGFGYYTSKNKLISAALAKKFDVKDIYGFYYYGKEAKIKNITPIIRKEINNSIKDK